MSLLQHLPHGLLDTLAGNLGRTSQHCVDLPASFLRGVPGSDECGAASAGRQFPGHHNVETGGDEEIDDRLQPALQDGGQFPSSQVGGTTLKTVADEAADEFRQRRSLGSRQLAQRLSLLWRKANFKPF